MIVQIAQILQLLVILAGPALPGTWLAARVFRSVDDKNVFARATVFIFSWIVLETFIAALLGMAGCLTRPGLMAGNLVFLVSGSVLLVFDTKKNNSSLRERFSVIPKLAAHEKIMTVFLLLLLILLLVQTTVVPVWDYDSLAYHLPGAAGFYQSGSLVRLDQFPVIGCYPFSWELLSAVFIFPLRSDMLATFPNILAWVLLGFALMGTGGLLGVRRIHSLAATTLLLSAPIVLENVNTLHVDLAFAAFFICALFFLFGFLKHRNLGFLIFFMVALGMLAGIKISGPLYGLLLCMLAASVEVLNRMRGKTRQIIVEKGDGLLLAGGLAIASACGAFWYVRNFALTGNPIGKVAVRLLGIELFPGQVDPARITQTSLAHSFDLLSVKNWEVFISQFSFKIGSFLVPALILSAVLGIGLLFRKSRCMADMKSVLLVMAAILLLIYWVTPYSGSNAAPEFRITSWMGQAIRYAFPFMAVLSLTAAMGMVFFRKLTGIYLTLLVMTGMCPGLIQLGKSVPVPVNNLVYPGILLIMGFATVRAWKIRRMRKTLTVFAMLGVFLLLFGNMAAEKRNSIKNRSYGRLTRFLEKHVEPGERIGYICGSQGYLYFGRKLQIRVAFVPSRNLNQTKWIRKIRDLGIRYVFLGPLEPRFMKNREIQWLNERGELFEQVLTDNSWRGKIRGFRLKPEGGEEFEAGI